MANFRQSGSHHLFWKDMFAKKSEASSFRNQWQCNKYETGSRKKRGEDETLQWHLLYAREKINGDFAEEKVFKDSLTALTLKHKILKRSCIALYLILFRCCPASKKYLMLKVFSGRLRKLFFSKTIIRHFILSSKWIFFLCRQDKTKILHSSIGE